MIWSNLFWASKYSLDCEEACLLVGVTGDFTIDSPRKGKQSKNTNMKVPSYFQLKISCQQQPPAFWLLCTAMLLFFGENHLPTVKNCPLDPGMRWKVPGLLKNEMWRLAHKHHVINLMGHKMETIVATYVYEFDFEYDLIWKRYVIKKIFYRSNIEVYMS